jgi:hypothetical protein
MPKPPVMLADSFALGGQEDGTWSFGAGYVKRRPLDEGTGATEPDEFIEFDLVHRYRDHIGRNYWATGLAYRDRDPANGSFAVRSELWHEVQMLPIDFRMQVAGYVQDPGEAIPPRKNDTEWSLLWRGGVLQRRDLSPVLYHVPSASLFARALSLDKSPYPPGRVDQDIFTTYKSNHRSGLVLSDTFSYAPWLDTELWLLGSLTTNENFDAFQPDHASLRLGWSQLLGQADFEASYRVTRYFADEDRRDATTQHLISLDAVVTSCLLDGCRYELDLSVQFDLVDDTATVSLAVAGHLGSRGYRDFAPGEVRFKPIKRRNEATQVNNLVLSGDP